MALSPKAPSKSLEKSATFAKSSPDAVARFIIELQRAQKELVSDVEMKGVQIADFVGKDVDIAKKETELPQKQESPGMEGGVEQASPV